MTSAHSGSRGFTLLEVLIAVAILSVGIMATLKSGIMLERTLGDAERTTEAVNLATSFLADMDIEGAPDFDDSGDFGDDYPGYAWKAESQPTELENLTRITLHVTWDEGDRELVIERLVFTP